jgi:hypothetical protein
MISHSVVGVDLPRILAEHQERAAALLASFALLSRCLIPSETAMPLAPASRLATLFAALLLTACTAPQGLAGKAAQQQKRADQLADEYLGCIESLIKKTAREKYADHITRRNVVLDSCQSSITPFTVVQEQAISNACMNAGKNSQMCDDEAVRKAQRDTEKLEQKARERIDAAPRPSYY